MSRTGKMKGTRLTVIKYSHTVNKKSIYLFRCDCGNEKKLRMDHVQQGEIVSCGCRQAEARIENLEKTKDIRPALISEGKQGKAPANKATRSLNSLYVIFFFTPVMGLSYIIASLLPLPSSMCKSKEL